MDIRLAYRAIIQFLAGHRDEADRLIKQYNHTVKYRKHRKINIKQFWDKREAGKAGRLAFLRELERVKQLEREIA